MLKLSDQKYKTTLNKKVRVLMKKVDTVQEQMGNVNIEIKVITKKRNTGSQNNYNRTEECL